MHQRAVTDVAEALSRVPCDLSAGHIEALEAHSSPADVEWLVLGVAMMGFLNKFMDAVGVELEPEARKLALHAEPGLNEQAIEDTVEFARQPPDLTACRPARRTQRWFHHPA